jgi:hypothetical protein
MELLKEYGFEVNDELSKDLLESKGINDLLNLEYLKIKCRVYYGFLFKYINHISKKDWFLFFLLDLNDLYDKNEITLDEKKLKDWIKYDTLF